MVFGGVKAWLFKDFIVAQQATSKALLDAQLLFKDFIVAQQATSKALLDAQLANSKALVDYMAANFATKQDVEERIQKSEEETDNALNEKFEEKYHGETAKTRYWDKRMENEEKDNAIINKAVSLGLPAAMGQMLLGRVKSELRAEYNSLTAEAIYQLSEEQLRGFMSRLGMGEAKQEALPQTKMYG